MMTFPVWSKKVITDQIAIYEKNMKETTLMVRRVVFLTESTGLCYILMFLLWPAPLLRGINFSAAI